ncbi:MAG: homoserine dehydrogenase [Deltaproteobacteria bacterium]|nr:homoserine dehydrogenase [Deltaproteobacteria bacterium]MBW2053141.1 homoserine dehydrogenase [Deltaproteobacteria bacterium]MBW2142310.1 homoserine dehydrogenase [Deltaproteobacteria bacterium]MBW2324473.1 homoserine dehydrogenase [Deltaproteobacteria bacterium]
MKPINIGLIGWGTVGSGVVKILLEDQALIQKKLERRLILKRIADLDLESPRPIQVDSSILTTNAEDIIKDPEIEIIIELMGGLEPARTFILKAIAAGKHVVTANKALLATHGQEIFKAAKEQGVEILFEASVGGCIPVIRTLKEDLPANHINHFFGILNGTANFILTKMSAEGVDFDQALAEAQAKGFAEADPTFDVDGIDTAHKLAILVSLAYGHELELDKIYVEGISQLALLDIQFAAEFGYVVKLLAISSSNESQIEARVHPALLPRDHVLAGVNGSFNAIFFNGHNVGDILLYGQGSGMMPTASAVASDIIDLARSISKGALRRVPSLAWREIGQDGMELKPMEETITTYYFRFSVLDRPSVLSKISGILGEHKISISAVIQKGREVKGAVPIVMMTHEAKEANVQKALSEINQLDMVRDKTVLIRVEDRF